MIGMNAVKKCLGILLAIVMMAALTSGDARAQSAADNGATEGPRVRRPARLGPIGADIGGLWLEFSFTTTGTNARGCMPADPGGLSCTPSAAGNSKFADAPPWTFTATQGAVLLTVTDAFLFGDQFRVLDSGTALGVTPAVASGGGCGSNPEVCLTDARSSSRTFGLGPGSHSITIRPVATVGQGAAYFRVDLACDADGDGDVDFGDAIAVLLAILRDQPLDGQGDCNLDGELTFGDIFAIIQASRG